MARSDTDTDTADAAQMARCAAGSPRALEELHAKYARSCLALARSILVDAYLAEDAVQEAFLDLWRHAERFDLEQSSVRAWLLLLTHRKAVDRVRSEQRRRTSHLLPGDDREDERPGPDARALTAFAGDRTRQALAALPSVKREVLVLAYWGGYTQREISALTSTPIGTVKSRMHSAMKDLSEALVHDGPTSRVPVPTLRNRRSLGRAAGHERQQVGGSPAVR